MSSDNLSGTKKKGKVKQLLDDHYESKVAKPMADRLDKIEALCQAELKKIQTQNKAVQGFIMQEVNGAISDKLFNAEITMEAWESVLMAEGLKIEDLKAKIDNKKLQIVEERKAKAAERNKQVALEGAAPSSEVTETTIQNSNEEQAQNPA